VRERLTSLAAILFATTAIASVANAQASYPCVNDAPNPYHQVPWAASPRALGPVNSVFVDVRDDVWVADRCGTPVDGPEGCAGSGLPTVRKFDPSGKTLWAFRPGELVSPHGIAVDQDGNVWVADFQANKAGNKGMQVIGFAPDGTVLRRIGKPGQPGPGNDAFNQPTGVAMVNGYLAISEGHGSKLNKSRVNLYTRTGDFVLSFASHGTGDGQLTEPHAIAVDSRDRIYVADRTGNRINVYEKNGKFVTSWKQFGRPSGVTVDKNDMIYVADSQSNEMNNPSCKMGIRVGSVKDGKVTAYIPPPPGVTNQLPPPEGIAVDSKGTIYAAAVQMKAIIKYAK
jgi:sugar lactone lactonase YvrE